MTTTATAAGPLLALIRKTETRHADAKAYLTIIGHEEKRLAKPLTSMTVDEVLAAQLVWVKQWEQPSGAAGAYQIIRKTLLGLKKALGLTGREKFDPALQDRMAMKLLEMRGLGKFLAGGWSIQTFGNSLAKEWASFPVFTRIKGARGKMLSPGQTFYAGDGINKALVSTAEVAKALEAIKGASDAPEPEPASSGFPERGARDSEEVALVQRRLKELGYVEVGNVDGDFGEFTEKAILLFRHDAGLKLNALIDEELVVALSQAKPRPVPASRENASPAEVRDKVPEAKDNWWSKIVAFWGMISAGVVALINFVVDSFEDAKEMVRPITDALFVIPPWLWAVLIGGGLLVIWLKSRGSEIKTVAAYQEGARR